MVKVGQYQTHKNKKSMGEPYTYQGLVSPLGGSLVCLYHGGIMKERFDEIWKKYPNRIGKKPALRSFLLTVKTDQDWENINLALKHYLESKRVNSGFIQNAKTWFYNWEDWVEYEEPVCKKCKGKGKYTSATGYDIHCSCKKEK